MLEAYPHGVVCLGNVSCTQPNQQCLTRPVVCAVLLLPRELPPKAPCWVRAFPERVMTALVSRLGCSQTVVELSCFTASRVDWCVQGWVLAWVLCLAPLGQAWIHNWVAAVRHMQRIRPAACMACWVCRV